MTEPDAAHRDVEPEQVVAPPPAEADSDPTEFMRWPIEFWDEPESAGEELIKAGILIEGQINVLEGHYEQGKTAMMIETARQWINMGRPVLHFDYEMGKRRVKQRMKANLWTPDMLDRWHYLYMPDLQPGALGRWIELINNPKLLVTLDSYSQAMMSLSRDENSATEAGQFWVTELQSALESGATILVIDQVKQNATARDKYAGRGTGAKSFGADVKWFVERFEKFSPTQSGLIKLTLQKDREGVLPPALGFRVGDGDGHLTVEPADVPKGSPVDEQAIEAVVNVIDSEGWQTPSAVKQKTDGYGDSTVRSTMQYLEMRGILISRPRQGKGGGMEYNLVSKALTTTTTQTNVPALD